MGLFSFLKRPVADEGETLERQSATSDLYDTQVADFWANLTSTSGAATPTLVDKVWVVNRCMQMTADAISTMPLRHSGAREPAWVANPDPVWFPNGIGDAVFAIVWSLLGWGDAFVLITSRYADGYPSAWTVLDPAPMTVEARGGRRVFRSGQTPLDREDVVQISRDPRGRLRGTSIIQSYAAYANGLLAAADLGRVMMGSGGIPNAVLKSQRKLSSEQAEQIQTDWMNRVAVRRGAPAVLPPDLSFETLAFSPADLMLLDAQKFDAQVLATSCGIPAQLVNLSLEGGLNYQTPILALEQWWRTSLRTTAARISRALSANMLPAGSYVEFDAREFLAPTFSELVEAWMKLIEGGVVSVDEFRAAVLNLGTQAAGPALAALTEPPSAGASPAQQPASVVSLRPTQAVSQ